MPQDQRNTKFETPPIEEIPRITREHVAYLESTTDDKAWKSAGMRHLILQTTGRKSGKTHKVALPYWCDSSGRRIIVASYAGGKKNPAWYHNLADKEANPKVWIQDREEREWVEVELLENEQYEETWAALTRDRDYYLDYQRKCDRQIPLIRLPARVQ